MPKLVPKIILEGTRLTQKTETAFALNEHPRLVGERKYRYHSPIVSGEWCGFTNAPWGRGLINYLPEEEGLARETFETWVRLFELLRYYSWIVDRFHLSTTAFQVREHGRVLDFSDLEARLSALNFRLVFLYRRPESFAAARAERLLVSGNPSQYDDLAVFIAEQEALRELVQSSCLQSLTLDVSDLSPSDAADRIADWMENTGGLWIP
jgi:hypothetical protein